MKTPRLNTIIQICLFEMNNKITHVWIEGVYKTIYSWRFIKVIFGLIQNQGKKIGQICFVNQMIMDKIDSLP